MRPTGPMHLGHLVGALKNWTGLQDEYECFFMVADWHALMSEYENPQAIRNSILEMVADWVGCGVDPSKCTIFVQSDIAEHMELGMVLGCITPLSWLERCPTYKEQLREMKTRDLTTYAFLGYPVLQAADILVYKADTVPVGVDQAAHLEITRKLAKRFNHFYGKVFTDPRTLLTETPKLLGFDNRKMSKSYNNFIALADPEKVVTKKIESMITDPKRIHVHDPGHPAKCNVHSYYKTFKPEIASVRAEECRKAKVGCTKCKEELAKIVNDVLSPIREKRENLLKDKGNIVSILEEGTSRAKKIASETMREVKDKISFLVR